MNDISNAITKVFLLIVGLCLALYVTIDVMLAEGRSLAQLYLYLAIAAFLFGVLAARPAFFLCLITTGYIDFFKRLMATFGRPRPEDLYYILGIPPLLIAGATLNLLIQFMIGRRPFRSTNFWLLVMSGGIFSLAMTQAIAASGYRSLGDAVNQGAYAFLFFLIPELLPKAQDREKIFRWMVPIFIGVGLYMLRHHFYGLADFEYDYLMSGLSIESRILWENEGALRGFSTMAGASVVAVFCSIMMLVVLVPLGVNQRVVGPGERIGRILLFLFFGYASWATVSRGGWVCGIAAFGIYVLLLNRWTAAMGYAAGALGVAALLIFAPTMIESNFLDTVQTKLTSMVGETDNVYAKRAMIMGTASDRLKGWQNLGHNPEVWTPFGLKQAGIRFDPNVDVIQYGHDFVIEFLVKYGYVALTIVVSVGIFLLFKMNRVYFSIQPGSDERRMCRLAIAVAGGIFVGGFGNGAQLWVYPQNFYFYLSLSIVLTTYVNLVKAKRSAVKQPGPIYGGRGATESLTPADPSGV